MRRAWAMTPAPSYSGPLKSGRVSLAAQSQRGRVHTRPELAWLEKLGRSQLGWAKETEAS